MNVDINSQYFWKWTNANPMKILSRLNRHPKLNWVKTKPRLAGNQMDRASILNI